MTVGANSQTGMKVPEKKMRKTALIVLFLCILFTLLMAVFRDRQYAFITLAMSAAACGVFFLGFERRESSAKKLVAVAVMTALSITGRMVFAALPFFKPVTAIVVITAMYLGPEAGFLTGALSAVISNFYFGQGPWTPFQMAVWGLLGLLAGLLSRILLRRPALLLLYGAFAGILFSLFMDVWTVFWMDGGFTLKRYLAAVAAALPVTIVYMSSNVVFLLLLTKPVGEKLQRVKMKYGL